MQLPAPTFCAEFPVAKIRPGKNIRPKASDAVLADLGNSLRNGQLQAVGATESGELIWGYQRYYAAQMAGLQTLEAKVFPDSLSDADRTMLAIVENLQRQEMKDWDTFQAVLRLEESGMSRGEIAKAIGVSPSRMTTYFSPLDCPPEVQEDLKNHLLTLGHCKAIAGSQVPHQTRKLLLGGKSIKAAEEAVAESIAEERAKAQPRKAAPVVKSQKIRVPLVGGAVVTIEGDELGLEEALEAAGEASKAIKAAIAKSLNVKTALALWKDLAAAG